MEIIITKSLSVKLIEKNSIKVIIDSAKLIEKSGSLITGVTFTYVDAPVKRKPRTVKVKNIKAWLAQKQVTAQGAAEKRK